MDYGSLCDANPYHLPKTSVGDSQLSIIFPVERIPHEIRGFLRRGQIEIEKESPPIHRYELPDKRVRVDWQVRWPRTGDIYKIIWNW